MNCYWLFTLDLLELALDEYVGLAHQGGKTIEEATEMGSQIRDFLLRSDAAAKYGLRIACAPTHIKPRGPGVTG